MRISQQKSLNLGFEKVRPKEERCIACHMAEGARVNCRSCHKKKVYRRVGQTFVIEALKDKGVSLLEDD